MNLLRRLMSWAVIVCWLVLLLWLPIFRPEGSYNASDAFQSQLPLPPPDPNFVSIAEGGRVYCGGQGSSWWLDVPRDYAEPVAEGGALFHCDPTGPVSEWAGRSGVWIDRGYLIGFWPTDLSIVKPFYLVLEVDPAQLDGADGGNFAGMYYYADQEQWRALPTSYDPGTSRVFVEIGEHLPSSGSPRPDDRFLIALFHEIPTPVPSPTDIPTASPTDTTAPPATPTSLPTAVSTSIPVQTATSTLLAPSETPEPDTPVPGPTPTPTSPPNFLWIPVGVVGVILGVAVGLWLGRRRE